LEQSALDHGRQHPDERRIIKGRIFVLLDKK
jgi:hypothetical protein